MNKNSVIETDVTIIGAGIGGLFAAYKLCVLGYKVLLVEEQATLASGPSTNNGGILHRGTFHSALINDKDNAFVTAKRCFYGYEQIKLFCPECIQYDSMPLYGIIKDDLLADRAIKRWNELKIPFNQITYDELSIEVPQINKAFAKYIFATQDLIVNFRILYQKLLFLARDYGLKVITNAEFQPGNLGKAQIKTPNNTYFVNAEIFIYTTGFKSKDFIARYFGGRIDLRIWKNHVLIAPRLTKNSIFCFDPGEASIGSQNNFSIIGKTQDDIEVTNLDAQPDPAKIKEVYEAVVRLNPSFAKMKIDFKPYVCWKVDVKKETEERSVHVELNLLREDSYLALSGKATTAPFLADQIVNLVFARKSNSEITFRQGDALYHSELTLPQIDIITTVQRNSE